MDQELIKQAVQARKPITEKETAFLLRNNIEALLAFMIENNPGSVNVALRNVLGYDKLSFNPNKDAIARQLQILVDRKNKDELNTVIKSFQLNKVGLTDTLITELENQFTK